MNYLIKPWQHQKEAVEKAAPLSEFAFLFEQGAGKSGALINTLRYKYASHGRVLRTLIICPVVVCSNWLDEFKLHSRVGDKVHVLTGPMSKRLKIFKEKCLSSGCVVVTNYEALQNKEFMKLLFDWWPEVLVADEAQKIKSPSAKRTKAAIKLADCARYRYILTGTPLLNKPLDIWAQYRFLDGGESFESNFFVFRSKYFFDKNAGMPRQKYFPDWRPLPSMDRTFHEKIYAKAMRVLKQDCMDLPPLVRQKLFVEMGVEQRKMYAQMEKAFVAYLNDKACVATIALTKALRLQQIVSGFFVDDEGGVSVYDRVPRLDALMDTLGDLVDDHKVIVWCCFRENYRMIGKRLKKSGIDHRVLVGGLSERERSEAIHDFRAGGARVLIANQGAAGVGINLIEASYSVYYSKSYRLEDDLQSEARNYRGGSEVHKKVTRIDLVAPGTIDEQITKALESKADMSEAILSLKNVL